MPKQLGQEWVSQNDQHPEGWKDLSSWLSGVFPRQKSEAKYPAFSAVHLDNSRLSHLNHSCVVMQPIVTEVQEV